MWSRSSCSVAVAFVARALVTTKMDVAARRRRRNGARCCVPCRTTCAHRSRRSTRSRPICDRERSTTSDAQRAARHHGRRNGSTRSIRREPVEHEPHRGRHVASRHATGRHRRARRTRARIASSIPVHDAIALDVPADLPFVRGDHTQLEQVVSNLLDNAVATHRARDRAACRCPCRRRGRSRSPSRDDGPGLPAVGRATCSWRRHTGHECRVSASRSSSRSCACTAVPSPLADAGLGTALTVSLPVAE